MLTLGASLKKHSSEYFENSTLFNYLFFFNTKFAIFSREYSYSTRSSKSFSSRQTYLTNWKILKLSYNAPTTSPINKLRAITKTHCSQIWSPKSFNTACPPKLNSEGSKAVTELHVNSQILYHNEIKVFKDLKR